MDDIMDEVKAEALNQLEQTGRPGRVQSLGVTLVGPGDYTEDGAAHVFREKAADSKAADADITVTIQQRLYQCSSFAQHEPFYSPFPSYEPTLACPECGGMITESQETQNLPEWDITNIEYTFDAG